MLSKFWYCAKKEPSIWFDKVYSGLKPWWVHISTKSSWRRVSEGGAAINLTKFSIKLVIMMSNHIMDSIKVTKMWIIIEEFIRKNRNKLLTWWFEFFELENFGTDFWFLKFSNFRSWCSRNFKFEQKDYQTASRRQNQHQPQEVENTASRKRRRVQISIFSNNLHLRYPTQKPTYPNNPNHDQPFTNFVFRNIFIKRRRVTTVIVGENEPRWILKFKGYAIKTTELSYAYVTVFTAVTISASDSHTIK